MSQFAPESLVPTQHVAITADTPCRKCGYNLRGLGSDGLCPECGTPIAVSISGDLLRYCEPAWVQRLARGARLIIAGVAVIILGAIASVVIGAVSGIRGTSPAILSALAGFAGNALIVIGSWLVTSPDPSGIGEDKYGTARRIIRITLLIGVINTFINLPGQFVALPPTVASVVKLIGGLAGIIGVIGFIAQLHYFEKLGERIPDAQLSSRANFLKKALPACYLAIILGGIAIALLAHAGTPPAGFACFLGLVGIAALVLGIIYLLMIEKFSKCFREQATMAEWNWACGTAGGDIAR